VNSTVVKVGGSLACDTEKLRALCAKLGELSKKYPLVVVPGGGKFADAVRDLDERFCLSPQISHRMAILGMDQYGLLLSDLIPNSCLVDSLGDVKVALESKKLPIFLTAKFILKDDPFEPSWDITSDSIAAYVATRLGVNRLILVTDVDGVFTKDPKIHSDAKLLSNVSAKILLSLSRRTSVDKFLPKYLSEHKLDCFVVNGNYPERIAELLAGKETVCTLITS
jgi:aspartokinase-like uncharacterized kinase